MGLIAGVVALEAQPMYGYLSAWFYGTPVSTAEMVLGFAGAGALCIMATLLPISFAKRRLEATER